MDGENENKNGFFCRMRYPMKLRVASRGIETHTYGGGHVFSESDREYLAAGLYSTRGTEPPIRRTIKDNVSRSSSLMIMMACLT